MGKYLLGIDLGSSNVKAAVFTYTGDVIGFGSEEVHELYPADGYIEQDGEEIWLQFQRSVRTAVKSSNVNSAEILGMSIASNRCGCMLMDETYHALTNIMTWRDTRSAAQVCSFVETNRDFELYHISGEEGLPQHTLFKALWAQQNLPEIWAKTRYIGFSPSDYVLLKLLHRCVTSRSIAQSTGLLDINVLDYSDVVLKRAGISRAMLPRLADSNEQIGSIDKMSAESLGLQEGMPVFGGMCDATASQLGTGSIQPGRFTVSIGTCGAIRTFSPFPKYEENKATQVRVVSPFGYVPSCTISDAGGVLKWFRNEFCGAELVEAERQNRDVYQMIDEAAEAIAPGCDGLLLLPCFTGASYAFKDNNASGVFAGIRNYHTHAHFARCIMEGVGMSLRIVLDKFYANGYSLSQICLGGGGARSYLWTQILADILKVPVSVPSCQESGCLGSAIMTAMGLGAYQSLEEAVNVMVHVEKTFLPTKKNEKVYDDMYKLYTKLYMGLSDSGFFALHGRLTHQG